MARLLLGKHTANCNLIVFDKDGTLIDFHYFWAGRVAAGVKAIAGRLAEDGFPADPNLSKLIFERVGFEPEANRFLGTGLLATSTNEEISDGISMALHEHGLPLDEAAQIVRDEFLPILIAPPQAKYVRSFGDLPGLLDSLHTAQVRVAVVTNDDRPITEATLRLLQVAHWVDALICGDDPIPSKPAPDAIFDLSRRFDTAPEQMVVVGDTYFDLLMAERAGVGTRAGVLSGAGLRQDLAPYTDVLLASIAEIRVDNSLQPAP